MKKILTNNWGLKLMALLIAFLLWLIVVNISDPEIIRTFSGIQVQVKNQQLMTESDLYYQIEKGDTVSVVLKGPRSVLGSLTPDQIVAVADLQNLSATNSVEIEYSLSIGQSSKSAQIEFVSKTISMVLRVENILTKTYPVEVVVSGSPAAGYVVDGYYSDVTEVDVTAPESVHENIHHVAVLVNVSGVTGEVSIDAAPRMVSESGVFIAVDSSTTHAELSSIPAYVGISYTKVVPVRYQTSGQVAYAHELMGVKSSLSEVCLLGDKAVLDNIKEISVPPEALSIDGLEESRSYEIELGEYISDNVTFYNAGKNQKYRSQKMTVSVEVEGWVSRYFTLPVSDILLSNTPRNSSVDFVSEEPVSVELRGLESAFADFDFKRDVQTYIDCSYLGAGAHTVPIHVELRRDDIVMEQQIEIAVNVQVVTETGGEMETTEQTTSDVTQE